MPIRLDDLIAAIGSEVELPSEQGHILVREGADGLLGIVLSGGIDRDAFPWAGGLVTLEIYKGSSCIGEFLGGSDGVIRLMRSQLENARALGASGAVFADAMYVTRAEFRFASEHTLMLMAPDDAGIDPQHPEWNGLVRTRGTVLGEDNPPADMTADQLVDAVWNLLFHKILYVEQWKKKPALEYWTRALHEVWSLRQQA